MHNLFNQEKLRYNFNWIVQISNSKDVKLYKIQQENLYVSVYSTET